MPTKRDDRIEYSKEGFQAFLTEAVLLAGGIRPFAKKHKFHITFIHLVLKGKRHVSPRLARAVGFEQGVKKIRVETYKRLR